jgi:hypothetical protein
MIKFKIFIILKKLNYLYYSYLNWINSFIRNFLLFHFKEKKIKNQISLKSNYFCLITLNIITNKKKIFFLRPNSDKFISFLK